MVLVLSGMFVCLFNRTSYTAGIKRDRYQIYFERSGVLEVALSVDFEHVWLEKVYICLLLIALIGRRLNYLTKPIGRSHRRTRKQSVREIRETFSASASGGGGCQTDQPWCIFAC